MSCDQLIKDVNVMTVKCDNTFLKCKCAQKKKKILNTHFKRSHNVLYSMFNLLRSFTSRKNDKIRVMHQNFTRVRRECFIRVLIAEVISSQPDPKLTEVTRVPLMAMGVS